MLSSSDEASDTDYYSSVEENVPLSSKLKAASYPTNTSATTSNSRKRRKFSWKVVGFTSCSKSCGGGKFLHAYQFDNILLIYLGINHPLIRCTRGDNVKAYSPKKCAHLQKPHVNESLMKCNSQPCPAFWKLGSINNIKF